MVAVAEAVRGHGSLCGAPPVGVGGVVAEIREAIAACQSCAEMAPWRKHPPDSFGTTATGYVLVGQAPERRPPRLPLVREALAAVGDARYRDLEDLFFLADAVHCQPARPGALRKGVLAACGRWLDIEIRVLHPRLVLALGAKACEAVLHRPVRMEEEHGIRLRLGEFEVLPLLMPSPAALPSLRRLGMDLAGYRRWLMRLLAGLIAAL